MKDVLMSFTLSKDKEERSKQLKVYDDLIINNIYRLLEHFGTRMDVGLGSCPCPIHRGKNPMGFSINLEPDHPYYGRWKCWSESYGETCMSEFINTPIGLVRALLTRDARESGEIAQDSIVKFYEVIEFCTNFFGVNGSRVLEEAKNVTFKDGPSALEFGLSKRQEAKVTSRNNTRDKVRCRLHMPPNYYLRRGFSEEVLNEFDVGVCLDAGKPMSNRVVVPVYDEEHEVLVGCVGRSMIENSDMKWKNSKGFSKSIWLYALNKSKDFIKSCGAAILVEGQGDVWRLWESGIKNVVGMFGANLSDVQIHLLKELNISNLVVLTDSDGAGQNAKEKIRKKCSNLFNIIDIDIPAKDVGEMSIEEINEHLKPQLKGYTND